MAAVSWDFEPRNVAFTLSVHATFHPSVGSASVSIPWLDATGALSSSASVGPLSALGADASRGSRSVHHRPGARRVRAEKELGSLPVTLALVQALRQAALPIKVLLPGPSGEAVEVLSSARVHLGPLLLAGGAAEPSSEDAESEEGASQGAQVAWTRPGKPQRVAAVLTDSIGVAGLYSLDIYISTDIPILSREMLDKLMPVCFTMEAVSSLPNESWLPDKYEDIHLEVYPQLSRVTSALADQLPHLRSIARPHDATARFSEPVVWFLGLTPPHVVREWLQHEGLVVEIHDRDVRTAEANGVGQEVGTEGGPPKLSGAELNVLLDRHGGHGEAVKRKPHPHGVARFQFGALLESRSLQVNLRSEVLPNRSDKKRTRAEAMKDGLPAKGLMDTEEGVGLVAQRSALDKREDTTDYHACGCVITLRASLAVPFPDMRAVQEKEHGQRQDHWAAHEQKHGEEGNIFVATPAQVDESAPAKHGVPRELPFRAKVALAGGSELVGPWRKQRVHAEDDERQLRAAAEVQADGAEDPTAAVRALHEELHQQPPHGLDCRFERFGRVVLVVDEGELDVISKVIKKVVVWNAGMKGLDPNKAEINTYQLSADERADPHLDILTGFSVLDRKARVMVLEGLRGKEGLKQLLEAIDRDGRPNSSGFKLLYNPDIGFSQRAYADFGTLCLTQIKIRMPLEKLAAQPELYAPGGLVANDTLEANQAVKLLMELRHMARLRGLRQGSAFPKAAHLVSLRILYGGFMTDAEMAGRPAAAAEGKAAADRGLSATGALAGAPGTRSLTDLGGVETLKFGELEGASLIKTTRKAPTEHRNTTYDESKKLTTSASAPNFHATNRDLVAKRSLENAKVNEANGKNKYKEAPFLEGQVVHMYSQQKLCSVEKQKDWLREKMDKEQGTKMYTYSENYQSGHFEFSGAKGPGLSTHEAACPNDTYANAEGDDRQPWRVIHSRPKEEFRKPSLPIDAARAEELHEAFVDNEWQTLPIGQERRLPIATHIRFEPDKVPHTRRITERPFDASKMQPGPQNFGPKAMWESVHYHGRAPGEDVYIEAERHLIREKEHARSKMLAGATMRTFSQGGTRKCIQDTDRYEQALKDTPSRRLRGRLDDPMPVGTQHQEEFHENGNPRMQWHGRLRENDSSPPFDVNTGTYMPRDKDGGSGMKRSLTSGTLGKAPWRHGADSFEKTKEAGNYVSERDFNTTKPPESRRHNESHVWKNASRTMTQDHEKQQLPYQLPVHYGVAHLIT
mmetsp:Transcript_1202/g.4941  ORF Transcript_1202/g.4941 Transcript_1202/m.4941 type:complete len:1253 (-) Transcript_1202:146-3904(-)